jgi:hypothetical protein
MNALKVFLVFALAAISLGSFAQMGITSYSVYALGVNTSQNKKISGDLKLFANRDVDHVQMETNVFFNFIPKPYHRFSVGAGVNFVPLKDFDRIYAFTFPAVLEIYPLQSFKKLSLLFELTPEWLPEDGVNLRSLWGVRYTFGE